MEILAARGVDLGDAARGSWRVRAELCLVFVEDAGLVGIAQARGALHHRVRRGLEAWGPVQLLIQLAQQGEGALGKRDVGG